MGTRSDELSAGQIIGERYLLSTPLGEGGMGSVWRATDATRDVDVAIKFVSLQSARGRDLGAMFQREADLSERMLSRNIVRVLDRGLDPRPYMVLELLQGKVLSRRLARGPLGVGETVTLVTQVCRALVRAHGVGVVHRDIKPDNLFLVHEDGNLLVKVLDFGVAALGLPDAAEPNVISGTIGYMSPEHMLEGMSGDERTDLFALGVVAYECITGKMPFSDRSLADYLMSVSTHKVVPPSTLRLDIPSGMDAWIERALAFDRNARFSSAKEMAEAMNEAYRPVVQAVVTASRRERARVADAAGSVMKPPPPKTPDSKPPTKRSAGKIAAARTTVPPPPNRAETVPEMPRASKSKAPPARASASRPPAAKGPASKPPASKPPVSKPPRGLPITMPAEAMPATKPPSSRRGGSVPAKARPDPIVSHVTVPPASPAERPTRRPPRNRTLASAGSADTTEPAAAERPPARDVEASGRYVVVVPRERRRKE